MVSSQLLCFLCRKCSWQWALGGIRPVACNEHQVCCCPADAPSTVTTWQLSTAYRGHRQALTALCVSLPSGPSIDETITVHAPHPPSLQPSLVPVSPSSAREDTHDSHTGEQPWTACAQLWYSF